MKLLYDKRGATAIEYGLIAALIGVAAMTGFSATGTGVNDQYCKIASKLTGGKCGPTKPGGWDAAAHEGFGEVAWNWLQLHDDERADNYSRVQQVESQGGKAVWFSSGSGDDYYVSVTSEEGWLELVQVPGSTKLK